MAEVMPNGEIDSENSINGIVFLIIIVSSLLVSIFSYHSILEFYFQKTLGNS
jgi:hypothetical protein